MPFDHVTATTQCPFARTAAVVHGSAWRAGSSFADNLAMSAAELRAFCGSARERRLHGFVFEPLIGPSAVSFADVREALRRVMSGLGELDPDAGAALRSGDIDRPGWQFRFFGVNLFTSLFAPCYPPAHTKHLPAAEHIAIFFQPDFSFDFCHVDRSSDGVRQTIRRLFDKAGRPYDTALIDRRVEAYIYMSPLTVGDPAVAWWEPGRITDIPD